MMTIALPTWNGRVSPVLDVASCLLVVDIERGRETGRREMVLESIDTTRRAGEIAGCGTSKIICGAVSKPLEKALSSSNVEIMPFVFGTVEEVIAAFIDGSLQEIVLPDAAGRIKRGRGGRD